MDPSGKSAIGRGAAKDKRWPKTLVLVASARHERALAWLLLDTSLSLWLKEHIGMRQ
jgi:hypothetical protein